LTSTGGSGSQATLLLDQGSIGQAQFPPTAVKAAAFGIFPAKRVFCRGFFIDFDAPTGASLG
jgi:hypothetical protein